MLTVNDEYDDSLNNSINTGDVSHIKNMLIKHKHTLNSDMIKHAISIITELTNEKVQDLLENLNLVD